MKYRYTDPKTGITTERIVYFPYPKALVPTIEQGRESLCQWGRRNGQEDPESGLPITGWARLEKIEDSYWQNFSPSKVLIPALEFCEKPQGFDKSLWYPSLKAKTYLLGLKLTKADKSFVYVVTRPPNRIFRDIDRVPALVDGDFQILEPLELELQNQTSLFERN